MKDEELIRTYVVEIEDLQKRGEYAKSYERAKQVLSLCDRDEIDPGTRCEILILAARSAYYVTSFDEALRLCSAAEDLLGANDLPARAARLFASALVRANVSRRRGNLKEALAILEPYRRVRRRGIPAGSRIRAAAHRRRVPVLSQRNPIRRGEPRGRARARDPLCGHEDEIPRAHHARSRRPEQGIARGRARVLRSREGSLPRGRGSLRRGRRRARRGHSPLSTGKILERRDGGSSARERSSRASAGASASARSLLALGSVATYRGEFARAVRCFRDAERIAGAGRIRPRARARPRISRRRASRTREARDRGEALPGVSPHRGGDRARRGYRASRSKEGSASSISRRTIPPPPWPICAEG